jgi:hypothetical protein
MFKIIGLFGFGIDKDRIEEQRFLNTKKTDPLVEFRDRVSARLQIEFAYYRFVNTCTIDVFIDFLCF